MAVRGSGNTLKILTPSEMPDCLGCWRGRRLRRLRLRAQSLRGLPHLSTHLLGPLTHGGQVTGRATFNPFLVTLCGLLYIRKELFVDETFPALLNGWLDSVPYSVEFPIRLKEQILVQQTEFSRAQACSQ